MNICCLIGRVASKSDLKFIARRKHKSIIELEVEASGRNVKVKAFDDVADFIYRQDIKYIAVEGEVRTGGYVEAEHVKKL